MKNKLLEAIKQVLKKRKLKVKEWAHTRVQDDDGWDIVHKTSSAMGRTNPPYAKGTYDYWKWISMNTSYDPDERDRANEKMRAIDPLRYKKEL
jgi:hypothetical protein